MLCNDLDPDLYVRGNILADDMGVGKTLQAIMLILAHSMGPTLIVVENSCSQQWADQLKQCSINPIIYGPSCKGVRFDDGPQSKQVRGSYSPRGQ